MDKPSKCSTCHKRFLMVGNLKRHNKAFHSTNRTNFSFLLFQCWHCHSTYARLEIAKKHAYNKHGDIEKKPRKTTTDNPRWKPEIFKLGPWNPHPEARPKTRTVYTINIPSISNESHINMIKRKKRINRLTLYIPLR